MKTKERSNTVVKLWHRFIGWRARRHDPLLSLSITYFNFSSPSGWDRLLQNQQRFSA
jgi:hypothetical protein